MTKEEIREGLERALKNELEALGAKGYNTVEQRVSMVHNVERLLWMLSDPYERGQK